MRISARGNRTAPPRAVAAGFTLVELLVVVAIVALTAGAVTLALRDPAADRLAREAARLTALLEAARAESRATGIAVWWLPARSDQGHEGFRFVGLPGEAARHRDWLDPQVRAEVRPADADASAAGGFGRAAGATAAPARIVLGPEAIIGAQRIVLTLGAQRLELATDGLGPFAPAQPAVERAARGRHAARATA